MFAYAGYRKYILLLLEIFTFAWKTVYLAYENYISKLHKQNLRNLNKCQQSCGWIYCFLGKENTFLIRSRVLENEPEGSSLCQESSLLETNLSQLSPIIIPTPCLRMFYIKITVECTSCFRVLGLRCSLQTQFLLFAHFIRHFPELHLVFRLILYENGIQKY
jgi:hypothetical protein